MALLERLRQERARERLRARKRPAPPVWDGLAAERRVLAGQLALLDASVTADPDTSGLLERERDRLRNALADVQCAEPKA